MSKYVMLNIDPNRFVGALINERGLYICILGQIFNFLILLTLTSLLEYIIVALFTARIHNCCIIQYIKKIYLALINNNTLARKAYLRNF